MNHWSKIKAFFGIKELEEDLIQQDLLQESVSPSPPSPHHDGEMEAQQEAWLAERNKQERIIKTLTEELKESQEALENLRTAISSQDGAGSSALTVSQEEINKLKKKLKSLEDELEEAIEDKEDAEKKLRKIKGELEHSQEELSQADSLRKQLEEQIDAVGQELQYAQQEGKEQSDALIFVREILRAEVLVDVDLEQKHQLINELHNLIHDKVYKILSDANANHTDVQALQEQVNRWKAIMKKPWLEGKTSIAIIGEFSAGKTSIVNKILVQDNPDAPLLPVSSKATTAIPTYISGNTHRQATYSFISPSGEEKKMQEDTFRKISKEVLDRVDGLDNLIKYFVMKYNNPNLEDLSILDTPGFNSTDKKDADRTLEVINECDALLWVVDVNSGTINQSSLSLIKDKLEKPLYIIINKVDSKAESEVDQVEELIKRTFQDKGVKYEKIIRFSQKHDVSTLMQEIKAIPKRNEVNTEFIRRAKGLLQALIDKKQRTVNESKKKIRETEFSIEQCNQTIGELFEDFFKKVEAIADIPKYSEGFLFFSDDKYTMTTDQYDDFLGHLIVLAGSQDETVKGIASEIHDEYQSLLSLETNLNNYQEELHASELGLQEYEPAFTRLDKLMQELSLK